MSALRFGRTKEKSGTDAWWIGFASCTREPNSWKEELYAAARDVAARTDKPIWIASSGGIDSEIACRAFFDQGIPFSVLTLAYEGGGNEHDIRYAKKWCADRSVPQKVVAVDMELFLTKEIDAYAEKYLATHPFYYLQIKIMEMIADMDGYAILCSGEQVYEARKDVPHLTRADLSLPFAEGRLAALEWCADKNPLFEPYFHFATPELCLAYLRLPLVAFALNTPESVFRHPSNAYTLKRLVYQSVWHDIETRYKYRGYERIRPIHDAAVDRLHTRFGKPDVHYLPVPEFEMQLTKNLSA